MRIASSSTSSTKKIKSKQTQSQKQISQHRQRVPQEQLKTDDKTKAEAKADTVSAGLAVCLIGSSKQKMYDSEYEEEVRKHAVMQEVLPDAVMWKKWEATEAPLRQGRGWYPTLDRHFLELLVVSEIHCLSHPLSVYSNATAEKIHRHASRVRRVACERIGGERLHAYCDRVKEAFEAYMQGGWGQSPSPGPVADQSAQSDEVDEEVNDEEEEEEGRGRGMDRKGSAALRREGPPSPPKAPITILTRDQKDKDKDEKDVRMVIDISPLHSPESDTDLDLDLDSGSDSDSDASLKTASTGANFGFLEEGERELMKIDLEGVIEVEEDEVESETRKGSHDVKDLDLGGEKSVAGPGSGNGGMDVDVILGSNAPQIHIVTPNDNAA